jgi:hypothetical protein
MADQRVYARTFSQTLTLVAGLFCLEKRSARRLRKEFDLDDEILNDRRADIGFEPRRRADAPAAQPANSRSVRIVTVEIARRHIRSSYGRTLNCRPLQFPRYRPRARCKLAATLKDRLRRMACRSKRGGQAVDVDEKRAEPQHARPVPSNRRKEKRPQAASPLPRTGSLNPLPSSRESDELSVPKRRSRTGCRDRCQIHCARVLEVRIHSPPAVSLVRT